MKLSIISVFLWTIFSETWMKTYATNPRHGFAFPKDIVSNPKLRIIGGDVVSPPHFYPFQAALYIPTGGSIAFCGGSLITTEWILTAAHCLDGNPRYVDVYLGAHNLRIQEPTRQTFRSRKYIIHPYWDADTLRNDIALVKLPQEAILNEFVNVIDIGLGNDTYAGKNGTILGWGITEAGATSNQLKKVIVQILSNEECKAMDPSYNLSITDNQLCTSGDGPKGSCNGDSGGPLVTDNNQVGLVSFGPENCTLGYPSVFTRVPDFVDWIEDAMLTNNSSNLIFNVFVLCFCIVCYLF